jgi:hypothetical protein
MMSQSCDFLFLRSENPAIQDAHNWTIVGLLLSWIHLNAEPTF